MSGRIGQFRTASLSTFRGSLQNVSNFHPPLTPLISKHFIDCTSGLSGF
jgi:hypothetical protein